MNRALKQRLGKTAPIVLGFVVVMGIYCLNSAHFRRVGLMAPDESYYTLAARSVYEGKVPYRDFAYTQMPFVPYINGFLMKIIGFGLEKHRLVSSFWGGLGLLILMAAMRQRFGKWEPAFVSGFMFAASPRWAFLQSMGVWCGVSGMLLNTALAAVLWRGSFRKRALVFAAAGVLAIGCRLTSAPILFLFGVVMLFQASDMRERLFLCILSLSLVLLAFVPFYLSDPDSFVFMNWTYHMESELTRPAPTKARMAWDVAPAAVVVLVIGLFAVPRLVGMKGWPEILLIVTGLVAMIVPMLPSGAWGSYLSSSVPVASIAGVTAFWTARMALNNPQRHVFWFLPVMSIFHIMPLEVIEGAATEVEEMGALIRAEVEEGPLLTPATIIAVESGRDVIVGTEMGHFSAMYPWDIERAEKFKMTTLPKLMQIIEDQEPAAVIFVYQPAGWLVWNFEWALPSMGFQTEPNMKEMSLVLNDCYRPIWRTSAMEVLVRRDDW